MASGFTSAASRLSKPFSGSISIDDGSSSGGGGGGGSDDPDLEPDPPEPRVKEEPEDEVPVPEDQDVAALLSEENMVVLREELERLRAQLLREERESEKKDRTIRKLRDHNDGNRWKCGRIRRKFVRKSEINCPLSFPTFQ